MKTAIAMNSAFPVAPRRLRRQSGNSLVVALIILGMITLLAVTNYRISDASLTVTGNMQQQDAVMSAANGVIQEVISTVRMIQTPTKIFTTPCDGVDNRRCVDIDADGVSDVVVNVTPAPTCIQSQVIPVNSLDVADEEDRPCMQGVAQTFGIAGAPSADSLCANTLFEVNAVANDAVTAASVTLPEGVAVRATTDDVDTACPPV
jgi:Tfp pilus assembly protein PilX